VENKEIASVFKQLGRLMELHDENEFKAKSYASAAFKIERLEMPLAGLSLAELDKIEGIGKSTASKIIELNETGNLDELQQYTDKTPAGVLKMMTIKGIGPKKAGMIWKEMNIETIGELLYACNENRLVGVKGFGEKTQEAIKKVIEFTISNTGKFHYAALENLSKFIIDGFKSQGIIQISEVGEMRRQCEVVDKIDILLAANYNKLSFQFLEDIGFGPKEGEIGIIINQDGVKVKLHFCPPSMFNALLVELTGNDAHFTMLKELIGTKWNENRDSEEEIYTSIGLDFVPPPMREGKYELEMAKNHHIPILITDKDIKGILHAHSTYSDGLKSLEIMATRCKELGYEYLGITDHSQSAFYANGLKPDRLIEQHKEIDELNKKLHPFKIFKGIESDILGDGSLDYEDKVLQSFDFIIASIHSNLKMTEEKATARLLAAIKNPYITILGHPTGRLILAREGYPIDHRAVIDACATHNVVIELNANPFRLDLDWRWIQYAKEQNVLISINPDAHSIEG
jgi:DNA polymerase (family 10)